MTAILNSHDLDVHTSCKAAFRTAQFFPVCRSVSQIFVAAVIGIAVVLGTIESFAPDARAQADAEIDEAATTLTGGSVREWVFDGWENLMGGDRECNAGESHHFSSDGVVMIERCDDGKVVKLEQTWKLERAGPADILLVVDDTRYELRFKNEEAVIRMRLRAPADEKTEVSVDRFFIFEPED